MSRLLKPFLKLPNELEIIKKDIVFDAETTVNLYAQDEADLDSKPILEAA
ncbi:hypothetical protein L3X37_10560 [Sabulilitoribacter arenilitoris]|uniref:Uncharacterized protein n=1 Tax=Wocania arenilitoris TaxID=2044858 RepID=A0AAE3ENP6_9FLAO|nr:hypothetical protein [Wocania arenilitoris]MCF7568801.1 hypothetical protein [Wocania arenilitoris]